MNARPAGSVTRRHGRQRAGRRLVDARPRLRARSARGSTGLLALAIIMLLAATSLAILTTVKTSIVVSRHSRDFLIARENLDTAIGNATARLNTLPLEPAGHGEAPHTGFAVTSTWKWTRKYTQGTDMNAGGIVHAEGTFGTKTQTTDRAWRARLVGSRPFLNGRYTYGIAAPSAWTSTLSSEDDSTVVGTVQGDWHAYGVGKITVPPGSSVDRVLSYDDAASFTGDTRFVRSTLSATLDERILNQRVSECARRGGLRRYISSQNGYILNAGQLSCYYSIVIDGPTTVIGAGVAAVISYGDIDIRASLTNQSGNQLHLYTASGTVKIRNNATVAAYVFAPNALCKTYGAATVTFTGSLACREIQLTGTFVQSSVPTPEPAWAGMPAETTAWVSYLENPGYIDRFTQ